MRNYILDKDKSKDFVCSYKIGEKVIKLELGDGRTKEVEYTKEKIKWIDELMVKQLEDAIKNGNIDEIRMSISNDKTLSGITSVITVVSFACNCLPFYRTDQIPNGLMGIFCLYVTFRSLLSAKANMDKIEDYDKNCYFQSHKDLINRSIHSSIIDSRTIGDILDGVSLRAKQIIYSVFYGGRDIVLNDIDEIDIKDLEIIISNIEKTENGKVKSYNNRPR